MVSLFNAYWLPCAFLALGLLPGLAVSRWLRVPAWLWLPLTLASAAFLAYGAFWVYFFDPALARRVTPIPVVVSALADRLYFELHKSGTPPALITLETRSSDRPPLQAAVVLSVRAAWCSAGPVGAIPSSGCNGNSSSISFRRWMS